MRNEGVGMRSIEKLLPGCEASESGMRFTRPVASAWCAPSHLLDQVHPSTNAVGRDPIWALVFRAGTAAHYL